MSQGVISGGDPEFSRLAVAGKTYVYLRTGRPILAVTSPGEVQKHIENAGAGWVVSPDDLPAIKKTILSIVDGYRHNLPMPGGRFDYSSQFRWDRLAGKLSDVFDSILRNDT